ncbi:MAG: hypothetical protein IKP49_06735 [Treponema sp.]|nr:hypothetical protein [Treponema sp.]
MKKSIIPIITILLATSIFFGCATINNSTVNNTELSLSESDKNEINQLISEIDVIMKEKRFDDWLNYIDKKSKAYWSKRSNLKNAQERMPVEGIELNSLEDFFNHVFIPARENCEIHEVRYISGTQVKCIEIRNNKDVIIYYLNKTNGKWLISIPPLGKKDKRANEK